MEGGRVNTCRNGHQLTADNVYERRQGWTTCRTCARNARRRYDEKRWPNGCMWREHHPAPHGPGHRRAGHDFHIILCNRCWEAAEGVNGDRYQVVSLTGINITQADSGSRYTVTTWYVQDRVYNHAVVAEFTCGPRAAAQHAPELAALELCARLNRDERQWEAAA